MRTSRAIAVIGFVVALALPAAGQEVMYGATGFGPPKGALGIVSQTNGEFTLLGVPTPSGQNLVGISFDSTGRLFGVFVTSGGGGGSTLIEINPNTGLLVQTIGPVQDASSKDVKITDLATQPGSDVLFGIDNGGKLWTINKGTAVATLVGGTGLDTGGIAFAPDGTLYLATNASATKFAKLDPATGLPIGMPLDLSNCFDGLAARPSDGVLFGTGCDCTGIFRIDAATGDLTQLKEEPTDCMADLAFKGGPPGLQAPALSLAAIALLGASLATAGVVLLARRRSLQRSLIARS